MLALRYLGLIGGLVGCAVILGTPPVLATAAGLLGALLGDGGGPMTAPVPARSATAAVAHADPGDP